MVRYGMRPLKSSSGSPKLRKRRHNPFALVGRPVIDMASATTRRPHACSGKEGSSGMVENSASPLSSSGAVSIKSRHSGMISLARSSG